MLVECEPAGPVVECCLLEFVVIYGMLPAYPGAGTVTQVAVLVEFVRTNGY
jgi:hypothetical protein